MSDKARTDDAARKGGIWREVIGWMLLDRKRLIWVVVLGMLTTAAGLVEPMVYRVAVNDVSGLFVDQAVKETRQAVRAEEGITTPHVAHHVHVKEPHRPGHVARRTPDEVFRTLLYAVLILFGVNMLGHVLWWIGDNLNVRLACSVERRYLEGTFGHVLRLPLRFFTGRSSSVIVKRMDQTEQLTEIMNGATQQLLPELISLVGILAIMFTQNVPLTLLALSVVPIYLWLAWRSSQRLETGLDAYYEQWEVVTARMQDAVAGIKTVKLSGAEQREVDALRAAADTAYTSYMKRSYLVNKYLFWETALTYLVNALVLGYGGYLALQHQLTPGDVVMFVAFIDRLYDPIDTLSTLWVDMQQNAASMRRSRDLLEAGTEEPRGEAFRVDHGRVEFRDVRFGYKPEREVLKGVSFTIAPGEKTAIVGHSGAGKTTTVDLLLKLFEPWSGSIVVDGRPLASADPSDVRRHIGMVMADGMVFRGTLAENIRYGRPEATAEEVREAALAAGMEHTLGRLPEGLETPVGESGVGLSVGERQRVQIARVLLAKPRILVLDEATANLDYATEQEVRRTIEEIRRANTVIVIAHRFSMIQDADQVIVLDDGRVAEMGSPSALIAQGGWFAAFARAQEDEELEEEEEEEEAEEVEEEEAEEEEASEEDEEGDPEEEEDEEEAGDA